jgi:hypothetical protein
MLYLNDLVPVPWDELWDGWQDGTGSGLAMSLTSTRNVRSCEQIRVRRHRMAGFCVGQLVVRLVYFSTEMDVIGLSAVIPAADWMPAIGPVNSAT